VVRAHPGVQRLIGEVHNVNVSVVRSCGGVLTVRVTPIVKTDVH
jgi:hypothetical protein